LLVPPRQRLLRAAPRVFGACDVNFLGVLCRVGEDSDFVVQNLKKASGNEVRILLRPLAYAELACYQGRNQCRVLRQDGELSHGAWSDYDIDAMIVENHPFGRDNLE